MSIKSIVITGGVVIFSLLFVKFGLLRGNSKKRFYIENLGAVVPTLNPHNMSDASSFRVGSDLYEGLVSYNQDCELVVAGAYNYEIINDWKTYIFHLRNNAKWSNGDPVTAEDYVYSYKRAVTPETIATSYIECMDDIVNAKSIKQGNLNSNELGVYADDKYTLRIELERPNFEFIYYLTLPVFLPVNKNNIEKNGRSSFTSPSTTVCNGAYILKKWDKSSKVELEKNKNYWDNANVNIENVRFLMVTDGYVDLNAFRSGSVHMTGSNLPPIKPEEYRREFGSKYKLFKTLVQNFFVFNLKNSKFSDIRVRKALSMALDRDILVKTILLTSSPSYLAIPEDIYGGEFERDIDAIAEYNWVKLTMDRRIEKAKILLSEAGYSIGNKLNIELYSFAGDNNRRVLEAVKDMYEKSFGGVVVCTLKFDDWKTFLDETDKGRFDIMSIGWAADYNLPSNFSMLYTTGNTGNHGFYSNESYDNLYHDSLVSSSVEEYLLKQHQLNKIVSNEYTRIPFAIGLTCKLVSDDIEGFKTERNVLHKYSTKDLKFKTN